MPTIKEMARRLGNLSTQKLMEIAEKRTSAAMRKLYRFQRKNSSLISQSARLLGTVGGRKAHAIYKDPKLWSKWGSLGASIRWGGKSNAHN